MEQDYNLTYKLLVVILSLMAGMLMVIRSKPLLNEPKSKLDAILGLALFTGGILLLTLFIVSLNHIFTKNAFTNF
jgi:hypothetical protein